MSNSMDEQILRAAKEIAVKFIEAGRLSPSGFSEAFKEIYGAIEQAAKPEKSDGEGEKKS